MIFLIKCDSPDFWQTYLQEPASITMEGILIFNKHLLFFINCNSFICCLVISVYHLLFC